MSAAATASAAYLCSRACLDARVPPFPSFGIAPGATNFTCGEKDEAGRVDLWGFFQKQQLDAVEYMHMSAKSLMALQSANKFVAVLD